MSSIRRGFLHKPVYLFLLLAASVHAGDGEAGDKTYEWVAWADMLYQDNVIEDSVPFFNVRNVYAGVKGSISERWLYFLLAEYSRDITFDGGESDELTVDRAFIEYRYSAAFRLRLGRVYSPAGIWKPIHWAITVDTINSPIMEDNGYIPNKTNGLEFLGTRVTAHGEWSYTLLVGGVEEEIDNRQTLHEARALGGDLNYLHSDRFKIGLSLYNYSQSEGGKANATGWMPYFETRFAADRFLLRAEYLTLERREDVSARAFYAKLKYRFTPQWYANYRYDYGDDERRQQGTNHQIHTMTLGWQPSDHWKFRGEISVNQREDRLGDDFERWALWTGFVF